MDALTCQTFSSRLQQKALKENLAYLELVDLGISQEQTKKKATNLPEGDKETVNRLKPENKQLRSQHSAQSKSNRCDKCVLLRFDKANDCPTIGKICNRFGKIDHFAARKLDDAADLGWGESDKSFGRILESSRVAKVQEDEKGQQDSICCQLWITNSNDEDFSSKI